MAARELTLTKWSNADLVSSFWHPRLLRDHSLQGGKRHPRDQWPSCQPFRLRVELKDKDGNLTAPGIPSKEVLLRKIAPIIPNLPNRRMRIEQMRMQREAFMAQQAAAQKAQAGSPVKTKKEDKAAAKKKGKK